jgi:hypothetical protein
MISRGKFILFYQINLFYIEINKFDIQVNQDCEMKIKTQKSQYQFLCLISLKHFLIKIALSIVVVEFAVEKKSCLLEIGVFSCFFFLHGKGGWTQYWAFGDCSGELFYRKFLNNFIKPKVGIQFLS